MKTDAATRWDGRTLRQLLSANLPIGLMLSGIAGACVLAWFSRMPVPIERPIVLAIAAFLLLLPSTGQTLMILRKVVAVYLIGVPFNEIYAQYAVVPIASGGLTISYSAGPCLLCALGSLLLWSRRRGPAAESPGWAPMLTAWLLAFAIIVAHMIALAVLFHTAYGYGYENDRLVLAHLSLCFLLFLMFWRPLDRRDLRVPAACVLTAFYLLLTLKR